MKHSLLVCLAALLLTPMMAQGLEPLIMYRGSPDDTAELKAKHAQYEHVQLEGRSALRVTTRTDSPWPGVDISAAKAWDLSAYSRVEFEVRNAGPRLLRVRVRVDNPTTDGRNDCIYTEVLLDAGETGVARFPLLRRNGVPGAEQLKGMKGVPANVGGPKGLDASNISRVLTFTLDETRPCVFEVLEIRAVGAYEPLKAAQDGGLFPILDEFGQYIHKDWPGKVHSLTELQASVASEQADLKAHPEPDGWNRFGGWAQGPTLKASGFFRVEKYAGKWWLVDPEGKLFFSHGIDSVGLWNVGTPITFRDGWFAGLPDRNDPKFKPFYYDRRSSIGDYAGQKVDVFVHAGMNLMHKYGDNWRSAWASLAHQRLRSWGLNTMGNWVQVEEARLRRTPYTVPAWIPIAKPPMLAGSSGHWQKFYDVFDPEFVPSVKRAMNHYANELGSVGDPWCIGYFVDNELPWGDEFSFGQAALRSPATQAAKIKLISDLRAKYIDITALNQAWKTSYESWEALAQSTSGLSEPKNASDDLRAYYKLTAQTYFRVVKEVLRELDPDHLYLGSRFHWVNPLAYEAASQYCDVVSMNLYKAGVEFFDPPTSADVPLLVGEYHFGALDRGMWHTGLVAVHDQADRAKAYQRYVNGALRNPQFVGTHWFEYLDQPTTGRPLDGENYNTGFLQITDIPYPEMVQAARRVGQHMYQLRSGQGPATATQP